MVGQPDVLRGPLGPEVPLVGEEGGERRRVEGWSAGGDLEGGHDLVSDVLVGDGEDGGQDDVWMPAEDALDRGGGEVLAVDPDPVVIPPGEVQEPRRVPVGEVAGPVPTIAESGLHGAIIGPVALEARATGLRDQLADAGVGVEQTSRLVELGHQALLEILWVEHHGPLKRCATEGTLGRISGPRHRGPALGRSVGIVHRAPEPVGEPVDVVDGGLVAEAGPQRGVGVVRSLLGGQDVGERLSHVVEIGDAVAPHVLDEAVGGEAPAAGECHRAPSGNAGPPSGHQRVGVEERHGHVGDVLGPERRHLADDLGDAGQATLGTSHGLWGTGRAGGEEQVAQRGRCDVVVDHVVGGGAEVRPQRLDSTGGVDDEDAV